MSCKVNITEWQIDCSDGQVKHPIEEELAMASLGFGFPWPAKRSGAAGWLLLAAVAVSAVGTAYLGYEIRSVGGEAVRMEQAFVAQVARHRVAASGFHLETRRLLDGMLEELRAALGETVAAAATAKRQVEVRAEELAAALEVERLRQQREVDGELISARAVTVSARARLGEITSDIGQVKAEVASAKSGADLAAVRVDGASGGLQSARARLLENTRDLEARRTMSERRYIQFRLDKGTSPQQVAEIALVLKDADVGRNRYTLELIANDWTIEEKDKAPNEPVTFYLSSAWQPYELVVNEIGHDRIAGYLTAPRWSRVSAD
jgi:hypothetical protein